MNSTSMRPIQLSIDLDAALRKIAQRQNLNDVHFAVQLVRHALALGPSHIHINTRGRTFQIQHDGSPIDEMEMHLIDAILQRRSQHEVYEALSRLERDYGIALLSVFVNEANVELRSGNHIMGVTSGKWAMSIANTKVRGVRIRIRRHRSQARRENRELRFFCEFSDAPIFLNRRLICHRAKLSNQILTGTVRQKMGTLALKMASPQGSNVILQGNLMG